MINTHPKDITMKKLILMLAMTLALTLTANMARADSSLLFDWYDDFDKAVAAYNDGDYATAFKLIKPLAEQGDAEAQYNLGQMYQYGEGVRKDAKEAARWYRMAANKHHTQAQYALGSCQISATQALICKASSQRLDISRPWASVIAYSGGPSSHRKIHSPSERRRQSCSPSRHHPLNSSTHF